MVSKTLWEQLTPANRWRLEHCIFQMELITDLRQAAKNPAVSFSIRAALMTFALLYVLPLHPMSMFIALGGGVSIILIDVSIKGLICARIFPN